MSDKLKSRVIQGKILLLVLAPIVMGIGLHSHFQSSWKKYDGYTVCEHVKSIQKLFPLKKLLQVSSHPNPFENCPSIYLEEYFVAVVSICFILALCSLVVSFLIDSKKLKCVDAGYHVIAAVLILIAGILYIVSAEKINNIFGDYTSGRGKSSTTIITRGDLRRGEKLVAGMLAILQSLLYVLLTILIMRET